VAAAAADALADNVVAVRSLSMHRLEIDALCTCVLRVRGVERALLALGLPLCDLGLGPDDPAAREVDACLLPERALRHAHLLLVRHQRALGLEYAGASPERQHSRAKVEGAHRPVTATERVRQRSEAVCVDGRRGRTAHAEEALDGEGVPSDTALVTSSLGRVRETGAREAGRETVRGRDHADADEAVAQRALRAREWALGVQRQGQQTRMPALFWSS
jgi:hypothetical protein